MNVGIQQLILLLVGFLVSGVGGTALLMLSERIQERRRLASEVPPVLSTEELSNLIKRYTDNDRLGTKVTVGAPYAGLGRRRQRVPNKAWTQVDTRMSDPSQQGTEASKSEHPLAEALRESAAKLERDYPFLRNAPSREPQREKTET